MSGRTATALTPDPTLERLAPRVWIGGSPLRLFRLSAAGDRLLGGLARRGRWCPDGDAETALGSRLVEAGAVHPQPSVPSADKRGEVTVVVPVRDDAEGLRGLLEDLEGRACAVIVVDDGSRVTVQLLWNTWSAVPADCRSVTQQHEARCCATPA